MDNLQNYLAAITGAFANDASPESRSAGVAACRAILAMLDPTPIAPEQVPAPVPLPPDPNIAALVSAIRGLPIDQLLDLAIVRLKAVLPVGAAVPEIQRLQFPILPISQRRVIP